MPALRQLVRSTHTPILEFIMNASEFTRASPRHAALALLVGSVAFAAKDGGGKPGGGTKPPPPNPVLTAVVDGYIVGMNADGSNRYIIAEIGTPSDIPAPVWSPDGTKRLSFTPALSLRLPRRTAPRLRICPRLGTTGRTPIDPSGARCLVQTPLVRVWNR